MKTQYNEGVVLDRYDYDTSRFVSRNYMNPNNRYRYVISELCMKDDMLLFLLSRWRLIYFIAFIWSLPILIRTSVAFTTIFFSTTYLTL